MQLLSMDLIHFSCGGIIHRSLSSPLNRLMTFIDFSLTTIIFICTYIKYVQEAQLVAVTFSHLVTSILLFPYHAYTIIVQSCTCCTQEEELRGGYIQTTRQTDIRIGRQNTMYGYCRVMNLISEGVEAQLPNCCHFQSLPSCYLHAHFTILYMYFLYIGRGAIYCQTDRHTGRQNIMYVNTE